MKINIKKLAALGATSLYLVTGAKVFAQDNVNVNIRAPEQGINPAAGVGTVLSNALTIVFVAAALVVLFFMIIGAFNWITSGGDKEKVGKARGTIINALIGLGILALALLIITVVGQILKIDVLKLDFIPTLDACPNGQVFNPTNGQCITPTRQ